jgi:hypothetical protein
MQQMNEKFSQMVRKPHLPLYNFGDAIEASHALEVA